MYLHLICFALPRGKAKRAVRAMGTGGVGDVRAADTVGSHERAFLHNLRRRRRRHRRSSTAAAVSLVVLVLCICIYICTSTSICMCVCV